jgi:ABC-type multidrug transport system permease subunit
MMLRATIVKDTRLLLRDRGALASLFALPLVFVVLFGSMFGSRDRDEQARPLAVARDPVDPVADKLVAAIDASGMFRTMAADDVDDLNRWVAHDAGRLGLIIPRDFDPAAGRPAQLVVDPEAPLQMRAPAEGALAAIIRRVHFGPPPGGDRPVLVPVSPEGRRTPLDVTSGFQVSVPGNAVLFGFFIALTVAISFVEEKKTGTWRRLLAAPVSRATLLLAKLVPYYIISLLQMTILFGVGALAFGMEVRGSPLALAALTAAVSFSAVSLGLLIASFGGSQKQVGSVGSISVLVMGLVGGAMVPRLIMPATLQHIGLATPHAWALDGFYAVLMRDGTGITDIGRPIAMVVGFGVLFAGIGIWRFDFER